MYAPDIPLGFPRVFACGRPQAAHFII